MQPMRLHLSLIHILMPTRIPNLLVNGASGIAVGMATNMPPHNLSEVIDACEAYIDNQEITVEELMTYVKAPYFPTGGYIYGISGVREGYLTGRGRVVMRAKAEIEAGQTHDKIVVTEIPYNCLLYTSFILAGDNMGPAKLEKAKKLGVTILSEDEFLKLIS